MNMIVFICGGIMGGIIGYVNDHGNKLISGNNRNFDIDSLKNIIKYSFIGGVINFFCMGFFRNPKDRFSRRRRKN